MKKKILAVVLSTVMVLSVAGCGSSNQTSTPAPETKEETEETTETTEETTEAAEETTETASSGSDYHFEIIVKSFQSTYWQAAVQGIEKACDELGVTANANGPANESDIADQV